MNKRPWNTFRTFLLLAALTLFTACGGNDKDDHILERSIPAEPESLDPHKSRTVQAADVLRDIGEGLVSYTATGELTPGVAESWQISDDGLTYTFSLRDDAKWSNGDAVIAKHFVAGFERLVDPATGAFYAEFLADIDTVAAPDDRSLVITLKQNTPYLIRLLAHPATFPIHDGALAEHGDDFAKPGKLLSNGAYLLDQWIPGSEILLQRNAQYWNNDATAIDTVRYHIIIEATTDVARFRAGEIDITSTVPTGLFERVKKELGDQLRVAPYLGVYYYGFNLTKPPFKDNDRLRQALSMAIDREQLVATVTRRGEPVAYGWVPPTIIDYEPVSFGYASLTQEERNQIARRLYEEAGYGEENPLEIELRYNTSSFDRGVAVAVQAMWKEVLGFEVTLVNEEFQVLVNNMREREITQVFRGSWIGDYNDAHTFLSIMQSDSPANMPGYANADFDDFMAKAAAQVDVRSRSLYLAEAERILLEDHPVIPIYFYISKRLISPRVKGWGDNILDYHYSQHLSLEAAE